MPKVSIVVPVYNVERYLEECLDSIVNQTLKDLEIIVVNDGSTDGSLDIAKRYAEADNRISIIDKENRGYGHTMNRGFEKASGEYIGIVESDDCARPAMFEDLYALAKANDADVVRSNYYTMGNNGTEFKLVDVLSMSGAPYLKPFTAQDYPNILRGSPAIWTGIYKKSFIEDNQIAFLETPGASYQDTGFILKSLAAAERIVITHKPYLNYRIDNANSSVKSGAKVFCVCDEYESFEAFLANRPESTQSFQNMIIAKKYETYLWNYNRLDESLKPQFLERMTKEFDEAKENGRLERGLYSNEEWADLNAIISNPASLKGRDLAVCPAPFNPIEHQRTRYIIGDISLLHFMAWRIKHALF